MNDQVRGNHPRHVTLSKLPSVSPPVLLCYDICTEHRVSSQRKYLFYATVIRIESFVNYYNRVLANSFVLILSSRFSLVQIGFRSLRTYLAYRIVVFLFLTTTMHVFSRILPSVTTAYVLQSSTYILRVFITSVTWTLTYHSLCPRFCPPTGGSVL